MASTTSEAQVPEDENIEFTKEEVDALLNQEFKGDTTDEEKMLDYIEGRMVRLENCVKWFHKTVEYPDTEKVKLLQQYNTSLQQYNSKLQNDNLKVEAEKTVILENHSTLRGHYNMLQTELTAAKDSRDEAFKQRDAALKEVEILRGELKQVREDHERQVHTASWSR